MPVKVGILAAGAPPRTLQPVFGDYPRMFEALFAGLGYDWRVYDVRAGDYPAQPEDCDGYIVTGSSAGAYDPDPWIAALLDFLRIARGRAKLVGVCFGHQAMAQAFGGQVIKSPKGWGVGLHTYHVAAAAPWMDEADAFSLAASHQDQVETLPPGARVLGGSDFCPFGLLAYDDGSAISIQLHPEFPAAYAAALIETRRGGRIAEDLARTAIESLTRPNDQAQVADWIDRFLRE